MQMLLFNYITIDFDLAFVHDERMYINYLLCLPLNDSGPNSVKYKNRLDRQHGFCHFNFNLLNNYQGMIIIKIFKI
jgi:hypothetical protein